MTLKGWIVLLSMAALAGCGEEDTYKYCRKYQRTGEDGVVYTVKECCVETCEEEFDGDIECEIECNCKIKDGENSYDCPFYPEDDI